MALMYTFGLGRLLYVTVLLLNAVSILNEERFVKRLSSSDAPRFGDAEESVSVRLLSLVRSIRTVTRPVLIAANILIILYELILG